MTCRPKYDLPQDFEACRQQAQMLADASAAVTAFADGSRPFLPFFEQVCIEDADRRIWNVGDDLRAAMLAAFPDRRAETVKAFAPMGDAPSSAEGRIHGTIGCTHF